MHRDANHRLNLSKHERETVSCECTTSCESSRKNFLWMKKEAKLENYFTLNHKRFSNKKKKSILLHNFKCFRWRKSRCKFTYFGEGKISESFLFRRSFNDFFIALTFIVPFFLIPSLEAVSRKFLIMFRAIDSTQKYWVFNYAMTLKIIFLLGEQRDVKELSLVQLHQIF